MFPNAAAWLPARAFLACVVGFGLCFGTIAARAADSARRRFDLPASEAAEALKLYAAQANREIIFPSDSLRGVHTNALKGEYAPREALDLLVANTGLTVVEDSESGALMIKFDYATLPAPGRSPSRADAVNGAGQKPSPLKSRLSAVASALGIGPRTVLPQAAAPPTDREEEAIRLGPFKVSGDADVGFVAASSLAGGRMATALKDTPVAYSVLTSEFLEAFNITNGADAADFAVNTVKYSGSGAEQGNGIFFNSAFIRGIPANPPTRNYFPYGIPADSYNTDRVDFSRGSNATLFGAGGNAGTQNSVTKQPTARRTIRDLKVQWGSLHKIRATADLNQPINDKLALRTNLMLEQSEDWRDRGWNDKRGIDMAAAYDLSPNFSIRAQVERRSEAKAIGTNRMRDQISAWDGKTIGELDASLGAVQLATAGVARQVQRFVRDVDNLGTAYNYQNQLITQGAAYNATATNFLNGKPIKSVGFSMRNTAMTDVFFSPDRFTAVFVGDPTFKLPSPNETPLWDVNHGRPTAKNTVSDFALYFSYRPAEGLFIEVSGDRNGLFQLTEFTVNDGIYQNYIDLQRSKPNGAPNPYFLQRYSDFSHMQINTMFETDAVNFQAGYIKDTPFARIQAALLGGVQNQLKRARMNFLMMNLSNILGRGMNSYFPQTDQNPQSIWTRQYANLRGQLPAPYPTATPIKVVDPLTGRSDMLTPYRTVQPSRPDLTQNADTKYKFLQLALNVDMFKNRLVFMGAARRDLTRLSTEQFVLADDMGTSWDGTTLRARPQAPVDYWTLTYHVKDANGLPLSEPRPADGRPRVMVNNVNTPLAQYAGDRFRDDFSPPDVAKGVNTRTVGAVVNLTRTIGLYANDSTTFSINPANLTARGGLIDPSVARSFDVGARLTLPNGKLAFSVGWYDAVQRGALFRLTQGFQPNYNAITNAAPVGDTSENGRNVQGAAVIPGGNNVWSTYDSDTRGFEAELTANFTRSWRLTLNAGTNRPMQENVAPDLPSFFVERDPLLRRVLADAGVIIGPDNAAFINPSINDPAKINVTKTQAAVDGWNAYQQVTIPTLLALNSTPSQQPGGAVLTANLATDYRFGSELSGLRVGFGINYRGRQIAGSRTTDTIVDPNNPARAIPDPTRGATNYFWLPSFYKAVGTLSYTYKFRQSSAQYPKTVTFELVVDNLFNLRGPVAEFNNPAGTSLQTATATAPRDFDISNPAIMTVAGSKNWQAPRSFTLGAKLEF